jgi:hypothetical protein
MKKQIIQVAMCYLLFLTSSYAQGWEKLYPKDSLRAASIVQTTDRGYLLSGASNSSQSSLVKTDINGTVLWTQDKDSSAVNAVLEAVDGNYVLAGARRHSTTFAKNAWLSKIDVAGNLIWSKSYEQVGNEVINSAQQTSDGGYILAGERRNSTGGASDIYIIKTNTIGDTVWTKTYGGADSDEANAIMQTTDGGYISAGIYGSATSFMSTAYLMKMDMNGDTVWMKIYGGLGAKEASSVVQTSDGGYILTGWSVVNGNSKTYVVKTDAVGNTLWENTYGGTGYSEGRSIKQTSDGGYVVAGQSVVVSAGNTNLLKIDALGNVEWSNWFNKQLGTSYGVAVVLVNDGYAILGQSYDTALSNWALHLIRTDTLGNSYTNYIKGNIFNDTSLNCQKEIVEKNISGILVQAIGNETWYGTTDSLGNYCILVDTGSYLVAAQQSVYWQACNNNVPVTMSNSYTNDTVDFPFQALINCSLMGVDLSTPFIRKNGSGSYYTVSYCNNGTVDATNVSIEVALDSDLDLLNTSIPIASQNNNVLTFNIGNVGYLDCGSFTILVIANSSSILGQTHCSEAHIYPDTLCLPNTWTGSIIDASAICNNDSIRFDLKNIGNTAFGSETYYIVEDHFIMRTGNTGVIPPSNSFVLTIPADTGKTYRISVVQNAGFPKLLGDSIASAAIEGCVPYLDGTFNTGFVTQFSNGNSSPFIAVDCQVNRGSYDPNDKSAQPAGYDAQHYIYNYTALDYKIRFQNTGTDTAFLVVLRDTISPLLDLTTLTMGASSHNYTWRVYGDRVLEITYANIMLPDSNVNEPASNGFVRYRMEQKDGNVAGDVIYNTADIYFDFNAPIRTNQTYHTIGENFVTVLSDQTILSEDNIEVKVYPNPFTQNATLEVHGKQFNELQLTIYDVSGRVVLEKQAHSNNKIEVSRGNLQPGIYLYQLLGDDALINTGKIVVQ